MIECLVMLVCLFRVWLGESCLYSDITLWEEPDETDGSKWSYDDTEVACQKWGVHSCFILSTNNI